MPWTDQTIPIAIATVISSVQILFRCGYQLFGLRQRTWHSDDSWIAFGLVPLILRTVSMVLVFELDKKSQAGRKLLIVGRITYIALCAKDPSFWKSWSPADTLEYNSLWCMKLGILGFYKRLKQGLTAKNNGIWMIWWTLMATFLIIILATLLECRPLHM